MKTDFSREPLVSVLITCRNQGAYLSEAVQSIQTGIDHEIILIDDGSTEPQTLDLLASYKEKYLVLRQEIQNLGAARNLGFSYSKGKFLVIMEADKVLRYDCINSGIPFLARFPRLDVMYGDWILQGDKPQKIRAQRFKRMVLLKRNHIYSCAIIRRRAWIAAKGFDARTPYDVDLDWAFWLQAMQAKARFIHYSKPFYETREKPETLKNKIYSDPKKRLINLLFLYHKKEMVILRFKDIKRISRYDFNELMVLWNLSIFYRSIRCGSYAHFMSSWKKIWNFGGIISKTRAVFSLIGLKLTSK